MLSKPSNELTPDDTRQHGLEELEELRTRVGYWKEDFLRQAPPGGGQGWEFLVKEFHAEIDEWLYPYVRRMIETEHISPKQAAEFMDYCYRQVLEVAEHLGITEDKPEEGKSSEAIPLIYKSREEG
jgi:hypothetical protein